jgi:hypothetical protein
MVVSFLSTKIHIHNSVCMMSNKLIEININKKHLSERYSAEVILVKMQNYLNTKRNINNACITMT